LVIPKLDEPVTDTLRKDSGAVEPQPTQTVLGRSVILRGELSGGEDLLIEGQFDGTINLEDHCLTVGQHGRVTAEIRAREVIVLGAVQGNITARDKVDIRKSGHVVGDLVSAAIAIEEGAYFKGSIDILREDATADRKPREVHAA
jgi:cytoskeletal protein CcmA (bactofilin family)